LLVQEIYLEPIGSQSVFAAPRALRLHTRADTVEVDELGNVSVPDAAARLHYTVESELAPEPPGPGARRSPARPLDAGLRARHVALPAVPPRVVALAREITAGSAGDQEAAQRLAAYLARELRYTRVLTPSPARDPVEDFLFVRRAGNCEYFAAALAVMLRSLDIPARVVNGFQRGEWNPYGRYFMVRLRDAHSWVEAWVPGAGWITLDPSPRGEAQASSALRDAGQYFDALRLRWYRYIVSWSLIDQLRAATTVQRAASRWSAWSVEPPDWAGVPRLALVPLALAAVAAVVVLSRRGARRVMAASTAPPAFYARALRALARRGLVPAPGETAREFARRAGEAAPACAPALERLTGVYERVRFGARTLTAAEAAEVAGWLGVVERGR
jgi:transglutaminase-like putative cysteine protease